jgi:hypothetical protein
MENIKVCISHNHHIEFTKIKCSVDGLSRWCLAESCHQMCFIRGWWQFYIYKMGKTSAELSSLHALVCVLSLTSYLGASPAEPSLPWNLFPQLYLSSYHMTFHPCLGSEKLKGVQMLFIISMFHLIEQKAVSCWIDWNPGKSLQFTNYKINTFVRLRYLPE